ncbi:hypothetical protein [Trichloromonas sp.]|uniref:hypothetical protein n=1 Tax=Trichloromonas sp. TaxID=3069249 RepID=UPI003D81B14A
MKVKGIDPKTGNEVEIEIEDLQEGFFESMRNFEMSDDAIKRLIDKMDISADAKSLFYSFSKATIKAGEYVIKIGRKILDYVCLVYREFPKVTFGVVFGAIVGALFSSIPFLGIVLGPIVTPIAIAIGLVGGLVLDIQDKALERKISEKVAAFSPLVAG